MTILQAVKVAKEAGRRVYIIGNGGSYANAMHICNDLILAGVRAHCLDPSTLTASANDFGYETVFSRWISLMGEPGDVLLALSGSGKSPNILRAMEVARNLDMEVFLETHYLKDHDMQESEELQLVQGHDLLRSLRDSS